VAWQKVRGISKFYIVVVTKDQMEEAVKRRILPECSIYLLSIRMQTDRTDDERMHTDLNNGS
jgi:hypothetical protein